MVITPRGHLMSAISQQEQQICEFLFKSLEGELSDEEIARLEELIVSGDEALRCYLDYSILFTDLVRHIRDEIT
jgi:hypothetical protein